MFYVQRDAQGELIRVETAPYAEATTLRSRPGLLTKKRR